MLVSFDIGGSRIRAARVTAPGAAAPFGAWATPRDDFTAFAGLLREAIAEAGPRARGAALSIAGVVDPADGRIRVANIPCLDGRAAGAELEAALDRPVIVANDADCFALAEATSGAGAGHRVVFGIILGTGVGGGLVIGGRIHGGAGGHAGEWGHGTVLRDVPDLPAWPCGCGLTGCLDTVGGARGLERLDARLHGAARDSRAILGGWRAGEAEATRTVGLWLELVSGPLAMVVNVVGASSVPVGGGLSNVAELVAALDGMVRSRILWRTDLPLVVPARHRVEPGLIGAGVLGWEELGLGRTGA